MINAFQQFYKISFYYLEKYPIMTFQSSVMKCNTVVTHSDMHTCVVTMVFVDYSIQMTMIRAVSVQTYAMVHNPYRYSDLLVGSDNLHQCTPTNTSMFNNRYV
ncbi:hypothetical protein QVD99_004015 [Batrachochytrium dendrobatidis]|nr:hypothetical protein QVD99_004015 [Batrachochytrium dendrobatidis]